MAAVGLLEGIRARATAQGMTLTDLARASGVQPGNLRRMFASNAGSPRLGSVMRLLKPLHCCIAPAGARSAEELAVFLGDLRLRDGPGWQQFLGSTGLQADKVAANFASSPEKLPLDLVMRLASALHVELEIVDDEAPNIDMTKRATTKPGRAPQSPAPRKARSSAASPPETSVDASADRPTSQQQPTDAAQPATASSPRTSGLPPLRPPRLGRYRDTPPTPASSRPPPIPWVPSVTPHALERAVLASISSEHWSGGFAFAWGMLRTGVELPARFLDRLGKMVEAAFQRPPRPRPAKRTTPMPPDPPAGCFDALDAAPLARFWRASKASGHRSTDTIISHDEMGLLAIHLSLDREIGVRLRLGPREHSHRIIDIIHIQRRRHPEPLLSQDVALEIMVGDQRRSFDYVRAGPVFGELVVGTRVYLVAAISNLLALVEVRADMARVIWGGRAEKLPEVRIDVEVEVTAQAEGEDDHASPSAREDTFPEGAALHQLQEIMARLQVETDARVAAEVALDAARSDRIRERDDRLAAEAGLAAERAAREEDRRARLSAEQELAAARQALNASQSAMVARLTEHLSQRATADQLFAATGKVLIQLNDAREQAVNAAHESWEDCAMLVARIRKLRRERDEALAEEARAREQYCQIRHELDSEHRRRINVETFIDGAAASRDVLEGEFATIAAPPSEGLSQAITERIAEVKAARAAALQNQMGDVQTGDFHEPLLLPLLPIIPRSDHRGETDSRIDASRTIGRHEPCPCGSGQRYKRCCWRRAGK